MLCIYIILLSLNERSDSWDGDCIIMTAYAFLNNNMDMLTISCTSCCHYFCISIYIYMICIDRKWIHKNSPYQFVAVAYRLNVNHEHKVFSFSLAHMNQFLSIQLAKCKLQSIEYVCTVWFRISNGSIFGYHFFVAFSLWLDFTN